MTEGRETLRWRHVLFVAWPLVFVTACGDAEASKDTGVTGAPRDLQIVAHQDDDLLFMSPDIADALEEGHALRTVYVTAGDAGLGESYWRERETGIEAAYAQLAGRPDEWVREDVMVSGKMLHVSTLAGDSNVSVVFLRLPDGGLQGEGFDATGNVSLQMLEGGQLATLTTVDGAGEYGRDEIVQVLTQAIVDFRPTHVRTLDASRTFGFDHSDHVQSALLAAEASAAYQRPHTLMAFRGYNVDREQANLSTTEHERKWETFLTYAVHDSEICGADGSSCPTSGDYYDTCAREYPYSPGIVVGSGGRCLEPSPSGSAVRLGRCIGSPDQGWELRADGRIEGASGSCLVGAQLGPCGAASDQVWVWTTGRQLQGATGCLSSDGSEVNVAPCTDDPSQVWRWYP